MNHSVELIAMRIRHLSALTATRGVSPLYSLVVCLALSFAPAHEVSAETTAGQEQLKQATTLLSSGSLDGTRATQAETALKAALQANPQFEDAYFELAVLYLRTQRVSESQQLLEQALGTLTEASDLIALLGVSYEVQGKSEQAQAQFSRAMAIDKTNAMAQNRLGAKSLRAGEPSQAIIHSRMALVDNPENINAYVNLAAAYYELKLFELARLVAKSALRFDAKSPPIHNLLGLILLQLDDVRGALREFQTALETDPKMVEALKNAGAVSLGFSDFKAAEGYFAQAVALDDSDTLSKISQAVALRGLERFEDSKTIYQSLLQAKPKHLAANYNLCILYAEYLNAGDAASLKRAITQCEQARDVLPANHEKKTEMDNRVEGLQITLEAVEEG